MVKQTEMKSSLFCHLPDLTGKNLKLGVLVFENIIGRMTARNKDYE